MREFVRFYLEILARRLLYRAKFHSRSEFTFRARRGTVDAYKIELRARDDTFRTVLSLRRHSSDLAGFVQIFAKYDYNLRCLGRWADISCCYDRLCDRGSPLILDLGANVGLASLYFAKNWPKARIIAVEPEEQNYRTMRENVAAVGTVQPLHAAVACEDTAVKIIDPNAEPWMMRTEVVGHDAGHSIKAVSVQSLLGMAPQGSLPFIVKIDVEGFEDNLFSRNVDWVALFPVIIIELHDWLLPGRGTARNFLQVIAQHDRDFICIGENVFSIANNYCFNAPLPRAEALLAGVR